MEEEEEATASKVAAPPPPEEHIKKHVTVNDEPEVFHIRPDTLEVEKQPKKKPVKALSFDSTVEELTPGNMANLVQDITDTIQICEERVIYQKLINAKLGFILVRIAESIKEYEILISRLNRYVVNGNEVTAKYFRDISHKLPPYGDYLEVVKGMEDPSLTLNGLEGPVEKTNLETLVEAIRKNTYSEGIFLSSFRVMNSNVSNYMRERQKQAENYSLQIGRWLTLKEHVTKHLDELRESLYEQATLLDLLGGDDSRIKPALDSSVEEGRLKPDVHSAPVPSERSSSSPKKTSSPDSSRNKDKRNASPKRNIPPPLVFSNELDALEESSFEPEATSTPVSFRGRRYADGYSIPNLPLTPDSLGRDRSGFRREFQFADSSLRELVSNDMPYVNNSFSPPSTPRSSFRPGFHSTPVGALTLYENDMSYDNQFLSSILPETPMSSRLIDSDMLGSAVPDFPTSPTTPRSNGRKGKGKPRLLRFSEEMEEPGSSPTPITPVSSKSKEGGNTCSIRSPVSSRSRDRENIYSRRSSISSDRDYGSFRPEFHSTAVPRRYSDGGPEDRYRYREGSRTKMEWDPPTHVRHASF